MMIQRNRMERHHSPSLSIVIASLLISMFSMSSCSAQQGRTGATDYSKAFLVDVRTPGEFAEGSVPGAVNIPLNEVEARVKEFQGKGQVVVFCRSGSRSGQAKSILDANGVANVVNGGTWQQVKNQIKAK